MYVVRRGEFGEGELVALLYSTACFQPFIVASPIAERYLCPRDVFKERFGLRGYKSVMGVFALRVCK